KTLEKDKLKRIIEQLEYFFETSPTNPEWERQFIKYISEIEKELNLADSMEKIKAHIAELKSQIDEFKNKREAIRSEIARLVQDLNTVKQELAQLKASRQEVYKELVKLKEKREELKKRREEIKSEILQLALKRKELRENRRALQEELEKYNVLLKALELAERNKARARAREERVESLKERAEALYNRLLNGERLTHDEIKILIEAGYLPEE
ncbi:MAG: coiled-coil protein, partial [Pyrobaculum sp.]